MQKASSLCALLAQESLDKQGLFLLALTYSSRGGNEEMAVRVLFAGESWITITTEIKGVDQFTLNGYGEGTRWVREALELDGVDVIHLPNHAAIRQFPATAEALKEYDCVILSDIGSNTLLLHPETTELSKRTPNRLQGIHDYVSGGGGLVMVGGYMSFQGIEGKAHYHDTPVEKCLPVVMLPYDDRVEMPQGFQPVCAAMEHPILAGIPKEWPVALSYNRIKPKPDAKVLLYYEEDPILAVWDYGGGRSAALAIDAAPHGAPPEMLNWKYYYQFWQQLVRWLVRREA